MLQISETDCIKIKNNVSMLMNSLNCKKKINSTFLQTYKRLYEATGKEEYKISAEAEVANIKFIDMMLSNAREIQSAITPIAKTA